MLWAQGSHQENFVPDLVGKSAAGGWKRPRSQLEIDLYLVGNKSRTWLEPLSHLVGRNIAPGWKKNTIKSFCFKQFHKAMGFIAASQILFLIVFSTSTEPD
jgi:hypothetical protein